MTVNELIEILMSCNKALEVVTDNYQTVDKVVDERIVRFDDNGIMKTSHQIVLKTNGDW